MPGDAAVMNVSANGASGDERALGVELGGVAVGDLADGRRRRHEVHLHPLEARGSASSRKSGCSARSRMSGRWLVPPKPVMRCCT